MITNWRATLLAMPYGFGAANKKPSSADAPCVVVTDGPSGEHLIALAHHSDAILEAFLVMAGRSSAVATTNLSEVRERLLETVGSIDWLVAKRDANDGAADQTGR